LAGELMAEQKVHSAEIEVRSPQVEAELVRRYQLEDFDKPQQLHAYYLLGIRGTVQFKYAAVPDDCPPRLKDLYPMAIDLGYHSPVPMCEGHEPISPASECPDLPPFHRAQWCYYGGSGLKAQVPLDALLTHGEEVLWPMLADYYHQVFYDQDEPYGSLGPGEYVPAEERRRQLRELADQLKSGQFEIEGGVDERA
jgi:hypothetical protein